MQIKMKVTYDGVEREVVAKPADIDAFEDEHGFGMDEAFLNPGPKRKTRNLFWMAWHVDRRTRATTLDYKDWLAGLDDIDVVEEGTVSPLDPAPSPG